MVKLTFWEEFSIEIIVAVLIFLLIRNYIDTTSWALWVWVVVLIVYFCISNIIVKLIKGKEVLDEEERIRKEKEERLNKKIESFSFKNWWRKQNKRDKVIFIIFGIMIALVILGWILG